MPLPVSEPEHPLSPALLRLISSVGKPNPLKLRGCLQLEAHNMPNGWIFNHTSEVCNTKFKKMLESGHLTKIVTSLRNYKHFSYPTQYWDTLWFSLLSIIMDIAESLYEERDREEAVLNMKTFFHALFIEPETLDFDEAYKTFVTSIASIPVYKSV